jgi:DNA polymerase II large subunit
MKCRKNVKIAGCKIVKNSIGRLMAKGKCEKCGTTVCRIVKNGTKSCSK